MSRRRRRPKDRIEIRGGQLGGNRLDGVVSRIAGIFNSGGFWIGVGIFLLALFARAMYLHDSRDNPTFYAPIVDSKTYDELAREVADGGV
ncbi:MAG: hypothetical protein ACYSR5_05270 [Planctomycetota bacterium]|jgi:hypothetical protein